MSAERPQRYGFGRAYKRGQAWWVSWYDKGDRRESVARVLGKPVSAVTERDAYKLLGERLRSKARGETVLPRYERATVAEMLADYERHLEAEKPATVDKFRSQIRATAGWLGPTRIQALNLVTLTEAARAREDAGWLRGTVKQRLGVLHAALVYWKRAGRLATVPDLPRLKVDNTRRTFFEREEVQALVAHMPEVARDISLVAAGTGWRIGEVLGLVWERVDLKERTLRLDTSKTGEARVRPLDAEVVAILERRWRTRVLGVPWVFWRGLVGGRAGAKVTETWYRTEYAVAAKAAGLVGKTPHAWRRSAYRDLVMAGVGLASAMELVGHKSLSAALRYQILDLARQRSAVTKLEQHRAGEARQGR